MHQKAYESLEDLGDLQREVVQVVWADAPVTAETVREKRSRPVKESTVRTVLRRLEEKGYITHTVDGRTYVYDAAEPRGGSPPRRCGASLTGSAMDRSKRSWWEWSTQT
jgi:Fe2+ or Zn2+ uptake regulation protein